MCVRVPIGSGSQASDGCESYVKTTTTTGTLGGRAVEMQRDRRGLCVRPLLPSGPEDDAWMFTAPGTARPLAGTRGVPP